MMKRRKIGALLLLPLLLVACNKTSVIYSDDTPFYFTLEKPSLRVVQFTDTHFTYGFDNFDQQTLNLITTIVNAADPDLVVFTGDQTLSISAPRLYKQLTEHMESLDVTWSFVFGNHDNDYHDYSKLLTAIESVNPERLLFKTGPELEDGGVGNFSINFTYDDEPFYNIYMIDSKTEQHTFKREGVSRYEYLSTAQIAWYEEKTNDDILLNTRSTIFMHVPLIQYLEYEQYIDSGGFVGEVNESVYPQSIDTGMFDAIVRQGVTDAVFAGHDHENNFAFYHEGVLLGYGQNSGFNSYGKLQEGARVIDIDNDKNLSTFILYGDLTSDYYI